MKNNLITMRTYWRLLPAILAFMLLAVSGRSQIYLSESFDGTTFPPIGWAQTQVTGTGLWARSTGGYSPTCTPHSGDGMLKYNYYSVNTAAALISPAFNLSSAANMIVEFWMYRDDDYANNAENVEILVNTAADIVGATSLGIVNRSKSLSPVETGTNGWYKYSFVIPASFNTANNYIILKGTSQDGNNIYVDDITVYKPLANDIQVKSVTTTPSVLSDGAAAILTATLVNQGSDAQSNVIVTFMDGATLVGTATVASIATGETKTATYGWTAAEGSHTITASVGTDDDNTNNVATYSFTVFGQNALVENFEGAWPPVGWSINPTTSSWQQYSVTPYEGSKCAYVSASAGKRLITPKLVINSGSSIMFYAKDGYGTYSIKLQYSTDKTTWTDVPSGSVSISSTYSKFTIDLGAIPAGNYYLAFDYELSYVSMYLDNVVGPDVVVEPTVAAITPTPAIAATNVVCIPTLSWSAGPLGGIPSGYKLYLGTDGGGTSAPTNLVNGTLQTASSYASSMLNYSTTYYWQIIPTNSLGDAPSCPIWSFTTMADPTKPLPYLQDFELGTTPDGWAINNFSLKSYGANASKSMTADMSYISSATFTSGPIGPATSSTQLLFDYRICVPAYFGYPVESYSLAATDKVEVKVSVDGGVTYNTIYTINKSNHVSSKEFATNYITLDASYSAKNLIFKFEVTKGGSAFQLDVDNFQVRQTPTTPIAKIDKTLLSFNYVPVGLLSQLQVKITNAGGGSLTINDGDLTLNGSDNNQFAIVTPSYPIILGAGSSEYIKVNFIATTAGVKSANLNIAHNASSSPVVVLLTGESYMPLSSFIENFETTAVDEFPKGWVGNFTGFAYGGVSDYATEAYSGTNSVTMMNSNTDLITLVTPAVTGLGTNRLKFWAKSSAAATSLLVGTVTNNTDPSTFTLVKTVELTTSYAQYFVDFSAYSGSDMFLAIKSSGGASTQYLDDVVWEVNPSTPMLGVDQSTSDFGIVDARNSGVKNVTLTNVGIGTITINASDIVISGVNASEFKIGSNVFPISLDATESTTLEVVFAPTTVGDKTATLTVAHNGSNPPVEVTLTGNALSKSSLIETFNNSTWPSATGWTVETGWSRQNYGPYEGAGHAYISPTGTVTNVKLVTPLLIIKSGDALTFYTKTTGSAVFPTIQVMYATAVGGPWTAIGSSISVSTSEYAKQVVDLTSLAGNNYYLAFAESGSAYKSVYLDMVTGPEVYHENVIPAFTSAPVTSAMVGHTYSYGITTIDANYDDLTITALGLPAWLTISDNGDGTATLSGTPDVAGDVDVIVSVSDGKLSMDQPFVIAVVGNTTPAFTSAALITGSVGHPYNYAVTTSDADGDVVSITATIKPEWLTLTDNGDGTATLSGTPTAAGDDNVTLNVSDGIADVEQSFTITVAAAANHAPEFTSTPIVGGEVGSAYNYSITAIDADGDALAITSVEVPTWLTLIDNGNGTASLSGTPTAFGSFDVKIQVSDGKVNVEQDFTVVVVATGIADNNIQNVTVYPNPASNELYLTNADGSNLQIFDMSGKLILSAKYEGRVDVSAIPSGSYLVRIATQYGFVLRKVQIVR